MKICTNCKTIHSDHDTPFIFCTVCGCAEWHIITDELPFCDDDKLIVKGVFDFDTKSKLKQVNVKVNPFPQSEKDFACISRAYGFINQ